ncbi:MAG: hypothetical protein LBV61_05535 [Burkholderiaceae bacterium]|jgi:uncharacterized membrane protein|nr:hypothetical protein [Burkholderiaceae bacterium]
MNFVTAIETALVLLALVVAFSLRPWRLMAGGRLLTPILGTLVLLPWLWALPTLHTMPLQLRWSGACLVLLMLGWPLAVLVLIAAALLAWVLAAALVPGPALALHDVIALVFWQGLLPATFGLALGALLRRLFGAHLFIYLLGRAFLGTVVCVFAAGALQNQAGPASPLFDSSLPLIAHWLFAWGDGIITGMLTTIFVAFKPHWLATWSDNLYLHTK